MAQVAITQMLMVLGGLARLRLWALFQAASVPMGL